MLADQVSGSRYVLTDEQVLELRKQLRGVVKVADLDTAIVEIDEAAAACRRSPLGTVFDGSMQRRLWKNEARLRRQIAYFASRLGGLVADVDPRLGDFRPEIPSFDWPALQEGLRLLASAAAAEAAAFQPTIQRGAPPDWLRDRLINLIHAVYPPGAAKKSDGSHFEQTVAMVLRFIDREPGDVHGLVIAALKRWSAAPK